MKVTIDPVTRIEGHLKVETKIENHRVIDAKCSADMFRGIEKALKGYDYLTAIQITQRVCGCCPYAHSEAAALAIENALNIELPYNGILLRNIIITSFKIADYLLHFYSLGAIDFINMKAVLAYNGKDEDLIKFKYYLLKELSSSNISPSILFLKNYEGNYLKLKELNFIIIKHYLEFFEIYKKLGELIRIFGNKFHHFTSIEPGGVSTIPTGDKIVHFMNLFKDIKSFVQQKYFQDVIEVSKEFKKYFKIGKADSNFLTFNTIKELDGNYVFSGGFSRDFNLEKKVDPYLIVEFQGYSYYKGNGGYKPLELDDLEPISYEEFENTKKYSWSRAPRYKGYVVEVGPAALLINTYLSGINKTFNKLVDKVNKEVGIVLKDYNSVMGRYLARAIISYHMVDKIEEYINLVKEGEKAITPLPKIPSNKIGVGLTEATRGALAHFIEIGENGFIRNYEMIVPSTWNISPKDDKGEKGILEKMLIGTYVEDEENPIEIARIIRSTDPCLGCAVH